MTWTKNPAVSIRLVVHALNGISSQKLDTKLNCLAHRVRENGKVTRKDEKALTEIDEALTAILLGAERCPTTS